MTNDKLMNYLSAIWIHLLDNNEKLELIKESNDRLVSSLSELSMNINGQIDDSLVFSHLADLDMYLKNRNSKL